ncbi:MAG: hypothetical protein GF398_07545 [Chitinivibrionales bacterium]|nr:hypothetical protein [Chitinivibrionales bacterium]
MASSFAPPEQVTFYCRFCQKILPAQLDRSIAGNGRSVDRNGTFEYSCSKCSKSFCVSGKDLIESSEAGQDATDNSRVYSPSEHFLIGEKVRHEKWEDEGFVVGKDPGTPNRMIVQFEKIGVKKLVEDIA